MRSSRPVVVSQVLGPLLLGGTLWAAMAAPAAQAGTASHCLIINSATNVRYTSLQSAQDAAMAGSTLWVRGICTGTTEITKNLTIAGQHHKGFAAPALNGSGEGSVLTIDSAAAVTINTLTITDGTANSGGGIANSGELTLNDAVITGNFASLDGGGIWSQGGTVTMTGSATITGNSAGDLGGGMFTTGTVTMDDSATITGSNTAQEGGGIWNQSGTVTMTGSATVTGNTADVTGGGILNHCGMLNGAVAGAGGNVFDNLPDDIVSVC